MKGAVPTFVSLVNRGANFTPFAQLRYNEKEQFGQDVEIHRVEFSKQVFESQEAVDAYLSENHFEQYTIEESENTWTVLGEDADKFEDVKPIEYEDGVLYFIGKLKEHSTEEAPAAEVTEAEEFADKQSEETVENPEASEEVVKESADLSADIKSEDEEVNSEVKEPASEEVESQFTEEKEEVEEISEEADKFAQFMTTEKYSLNSGSFREVFDSYRSSRNVIPSYDMLTYALNDCNYTALMNDDWNQVKTNLNDYFSALSGMVAATKSLAYSDEPVVETEEDKMRIGEEKYNELLAKFEELSEKVAKFEEKEKETVDEEEVLIQNSQSNIVDEILPTEEKKIDPEAEAFAQKRKNDLFGL